MHPSNNKKRLPIDKLRSTDEIIVKKRHASPPHRAAVQGLQ